MAKYLIVFAAIGATLVMVDSAAARGHRRGGCAGGNCHIGHHHGGYYGGCVGGNCGAAVYDSGYAADSVDPDPVVAEAPVVRTAPAPRYTTFRRGLFGWRRF
jgi:hypothetical protein